MAEVLRRVDLVEGLQVYVKKAEVIRLALTIGADIDTDEEWQLDFSLAPLVERDGAESPLRIPTSFMTDAVELSKTERTLLEDVPYARIIGYPRFSSVDERWVTSQRHITPEAEDELTAEVIIPDPKAQNLPGTMNVYLLGPATE